MLFMFLWILRIHQDVINEYHYKLVQIRVEYPIHQVYECCRCCSDPRAQPDLVGGSELKARGRPVEAIDQILLVVVLLNFCFQKCCDPNPRLDLVGGSKSEPGLLLHFQLSSQNILFMLFNFRPFNYAEAFHFGQAHKHLQFQKTHNIYIYQHAFTK